MFCLLIKSYKMCAVHKIIKNLQMPVGKTKIKYTYGAIKISFFITI